jgi:tetraacyldisaccharide-1-P 4'-kinase
MILTTVGIDNPLVGYAEYAYTLRKMVEIAGFKNADSFFKPVDPNWKPQAPAAPQPDPALVLAEQQVKALQAEIVRKDKEAEVKAYTEAERLRLDDDFRRDKLDQDRTLALTELEMKYGSQIVTADAQIRADIEKNRDSLAQQTQVAAMQPMGPAPDETFQP